MSSMKLKGLILVILVLGALLGTGVVGAAGENPAQLSKAGWTCFNAGPHTWVHCIPPGAGNSPAIMIVKVFDTTDVTSIDADYLGTELLIHADLYNGQPCPQNHLEEYEDLFPVTGAPYYACHHFDTDHH